MRFALLVSAVAMPLISLVAGSPVEAQSENLAKRQSSCRPGTFRNNGGCTPCTDRFVGARTCNPSRATSCNLGYLSNGACASTCPQGQFANYYGHTCDNQPTTSPNPQAQSAYRVYRSRYASSSSSVSRASVSKSISKSKAQSAAYSRYLSRYASSKSSAIAAGSPTTTTRPSPSATCAVRNCTADVPSHSTPKCINNQCSFQCNKGYRLNQAGTACLIDFTSNTNNCGTNGNVCPPPYMGSGSAACVNSQCTISCPSGTTATGLGTSMAYCKAN